MTRSHSYRRFHSASPNTPAAIASPDNSVQVLAPDGTVLATLAGTKESVAAGILRLIQERLITFSQELNEIEMD